VKASFQSIAGYISNVLNIALKPKNLWPGLLVIVLLASAGASLALPFRRAVVVWFPDSRSAQGSVSRAELRYVRLGGDAAAQAGLVVEELLLGPLQATSRPISVPTARVVSSIKSRKTLYVDVSSEMLFGKSNPAGVYSAPPLQPQVALGFIERSLRWNFPFFRIVLTIGGLEPSWRPLKVDEES